MRRCGAVDYDETRTRGLRVPAVQLHVQDTIGTPCGGACMWERCRQGLRGGLCVDRDALVAVVVTVRGGPWRRPVAVRCRDDGRGGRRHQAVGRLPSGTLPWVVH